MRFFKKITVFKLVSLILWTQAINCFASDFSIVADKIIFNKKRGLIEAKGNVVVNLNSVTLKTSNLTYQEKSDLIQIKSAILIKTQGGARVISDFAEVNKLISGDS